ncbi:MAG: CofH family radical SAM protein [Bdellovibrionales bacterium]|nr:CofH family radical SAM protein [Bdellovibrionales bacterium]
MKSNTQAIVDAVSSGQRISEQEAMELYRNAPLSTLGALANQKRQAANPGDRVSYLIDRNINYTNVCNSDCTFCGFYQYDPRHPEAYVLSREQIREKIDEALELGATRILLQGGHNDELSYDFYVELISWIHDNFDIEINSFSPSEIHQMHLVSGKSYVDILTELQAAGMRGLPGGGAEILDDEVRKRVSPKKIRSQTWLDIMEIAQELGLTTTATMVIGFGESVENRINHLSGLRNLQDKSLAKGKAGFNAFISWVLQKNENTSMGRSRHRDTYGASSSEYLRNVAIGRIFLDNIIHHQASWPTLGPDVAQIGLHFGCDDFGSTMMEENVVSKAGALTQSKWEMSPEELRDEIRGAGFIPVQRNSSYEVIRVY